MRRYPVVSSLKSDTFLADKGHICGVALATIAISVLLCAGCGTKQDTATEEAATAPRVAVVRVIRHDMSSQLEIASEFEPFQQINVYAKVSGYIRKLNIDWGTHVTKGQVLAILEIPELQQQLALDQAGVKRSEQGVSQAQQELKRAKSTHTVAHLTYTRLADVQKTRPELVAQQEIDVAQGKDQEASAGVSAAEDAQAASQQQLEESKAAFEKDRALFAYSQITAPFDGVVTEMDAFTGSLLPAGTSSNKGDEALCTLSQNDLLRLVIPVPERAVPYVHDGQTVTVNVSGLNQKFDGKIVRFSDQIDPQTRTMHTEVNVPNPKFVLVPGMYATVEIPLHTVHNVLAVPVQAVQASGENQGTVLVVNSSNRIENRDVTLGLQGAREIEVVSGLQEGDRVVFGEQSQFKPGELVNPTVITPSDAS
jgi:RND family efflux transporter MFP subunit